MLWVRSVLFLLFRIRTIKAWIRILFLVIMKSRNQTKRSGVSTLIGGAGQNDVIKQYFSHNRGVSVVLSLSLFLLFTRTHTQYPRTLFVFVLFYLFLPGQVSLSSLRYSTFLHNEPAAHQVLRCRIRTRDLCPRSQVSYQ